MALYKHFDGHGRKKSTIAFTPGSGTWSQLDDGIYYLFYLYQNIQ